MMTDVQFFTIIGMLAAGFGWMFYKISDVSKKVTSLESRVTVIETILAMMGMPIKNKGENK